MSTLSKDQRFEAFSKFREANGRGDDGFKTPELATEYARLKTDWWGSNLVYLGNEEVDGLFYPKFNSFD
jgi:hypothetical protein